MGKVKTGARVGAILKASPKEVHLLGYGVYDGDYEPPTFMGLTKEELLEEWKRHGIEDTPLPTNPRITLDNGNVVWGNECWWASEEQIQTMIGERTVVHATLED
jgi:hypothetical protein